MFGFGPTQPPVRRCEPLVLGASMLVVAAVLCAGCTAVSEGDCPQPCEAGWVCDSAAQRCVLASQTRQTQLEEPDASGGEGCEATFEEPNDVFGTPYAVAESSTWSANARLCSGDVDWYTFTVGAGEQLLVVLSSAPGVGDLELSAYSDAQRLITHAWTHHGRKLLDVGPFDTARTIHVQVQPTAALTSTDYTLRSSTLGLCFDDMAQVCAPGSEGCDCPTMSPVHGSYSPYCSPFMGCLESVCEEGSVTCALHCLDVLDYTAPNDTLRNLYTCYEDASCEDDMVCQQHECLPEQMLYTTTCSPTQLLVAESMPQALPNTALSVEPLSLEEGLAGGFFMLGGGSTQSAAAQSTPPPRASLAGFSMDKTSVVANSSDVQTLRLTLADATDVREVRLAINWALHVENGRGVSAYFQWTLDGCRELVPSSYGNSDVYLQPGCTRTLHPDGSAEYAFPFTVHASYRTGGLDQLNNQVTGMWYDSLGNPVYWPQLTSSGAGFDVVGGSVPTGALVDFSFHKTPVTTDSSDKQVFWLTLGNAADVDDVRVMINHGPHAGGLSPRGHFRWTPTGCYEYGPNSDGNPNVLLLHQTSSNCRRILNPDGSALFVFPFTLHPSFGVLSNNQVSGEWYDGQTSLTGGWVPLTHPNAGFDTVAGSVPEGAMMEFAFDKPTVLADSSDVQTLRLKLGNAANVGELQITINHEWHVENGRGKSGLLYWTPSTCIEYAPTLYGNADIELLSCSHTLNPDGSAEFEFPIRVATSYGMADNNQVSGFWWHNDGTALSPSWLRLTAPGAGFNVALPIVCSVQDDIDSDGDGTCDTDDEDDDGDGAADGADNCPLTANSDQLDTDGDQQGDACDSDDDNDGVDDGADSNPTDPNLCADTDGDSCDDCTSGTSQPG
ncbi:MAG: hypothetical protein AAFX99_26480, partial [Myxococcota bacterium]